MKEPGARNALLIANVLFDFGLCVKMVDLLVLAVRDLAYVRYRAEDEVLHVCSDRRVHQRLPSASLV